MAQIDTTPSSRRRRILIPGLLVAGVLSVTGVLLLSERFQWLTFNEKKNYSIALGQSSIREIDLLSIVTTSPQKGLLSTRVKFPQGEEYAHAHHYLMSYAMNYKGGASNLFLVDAPDAEQVLRATNRVFAGGQSVDVPVVPNVARPVKGNHWLVVFLGRGHSSPTKYVVEGVEIGKGKITMKYNQPKVTIQMVTMDIHPYYYWVSLGNLPKGIYTLQLVETDLNAPKLTRRVEVK